MSKRGRQKKAENVEKRRLQMEEAMECLAVKHAAEKQMQIIVKRTPKQCTFRYCRRYVDPSCTVCPYCGTPIAGDCPTALEGHAEPFADSTSTVLEAVCRR